jgi:hypothetical protein
MSRKFKVQIESDVADGTAPIIVDSSTLVSNLNADLLDGQEGSYYSPIDSPSFTGNPLAPTQTTGNDSTRLATTAFVSDAISGVSTGAAYQTTAPASPSVGDVWVDSDEALSAFSSNDFMLKAGGTFTGGVIGTAATFTGLVSGNTATFTGLVSGITPTSSNNFTTKEYVDNSSSGFSPFLLGGM